VCWIFEVAEHNQFVVPRKARTMGASVLSARTSLSLSLRAFNASPGSCTEAELAGRVRPNTSFKRTHNGMAPGPRGRLVYHRPRGPGSTPLRAA
jgi:hypothetical protein